MLFFPRVPWLLLLVARVHIVAVVVAVGNIDVIALDVGLLIAGGLAVALEHRAFLVVVDVLQIFADHLEKFGVREQILFVPGVLGEGTRC